MFGNIIEEIVLEVSKAEKRSLRQRGLDRQVPSGSPSSDATWKQRMKRGPGTSRDSKGSNVATAFKLRNRDGYAGKTASKYIDDLRARRANRK